MSGFFLASFDRLVDFDLDGCSITLDLDIAEMVDGDFNDYTQALPVHVAPLAGAGIAPRQPATREGHY